MTLLRQRPTAPSGTWGRVESLSLEDGLSKMGLAATPLQLRQLELYATLLLKWNSTYNLLGATTAQALLQSHLLDSLAAQPALLRWLPSNNPVLLDIGSGAGLPGVPLAILMAQLRILLVEPIGKKSAFLRQAVAECNLALARVLEGRIQDLTLAEEVVGVFGVPPDPMNLSRYTLHFICRAFTSLDRFASLCLPHMATDSLLFAMKSLRVGEEVERLDDTIELLALEPLETFQKDVQRNLVVMRAKPTTTSDTTRHGQ